MILKKTYFVQGTSTESVDKNSASLCTAAAIHEVGQDGRMVTDGGGKIDPEGEEKFWQTEPNSGRGHHIKLKVTMRVC